MGDSIVNRSGSITTGGTQQQLAPIVKDRRGLWFQNVSDTDMWLNDLGNAVAGQPSIKVPAGAIFVWTRDEGLTTNAISVLCATTGKQFSAREW